MKKLNVDFSKLEELMNKLQVVEDEGTLNKLDYSDSDWLVLGNFLNTSSRVAEMWRAESRYQRNMEEVRAGRAVLVKPGDLYSDDEWDW